MTGYAWVWLIQTPVWLGATLLDGDQVMAGLQVNNYDQGSKI
jgi:hypothetical protein